MASHCIVTGRAGFVGITLIDRLPGDGHHITGVGNFSSGQRRFIESALKNPRFHLIGGDLSDSSDLSASFRDGDCVINIAANGDTRYQ